MSLLDQDLEPPAPVVQLSPSDQPVRWPAHPRRPWLGPHPHQPCFYQVYARYYQAVGGGRVAGGTAAGFLQKSGLPTQTLRQIWACADSKKEGFLDQQGFYVALKLVALAQNGIEPVIAHISRPCPPPSLGDAPPVAAPPVASAVTPSLFNTQFQALGPINGFLPASKGRDFFMKSGLPTDKLAQIWQLAGVVCGVLVITENYGILVYAVHELPCKQMYVGVE